MACLPLYFCCIAGSLPVSNPARILDGDKALGNELLVLTWLWSGVFPFSFLDILPPLQEGLALGGRGHALGRHTAATMPILLTGQDHILLISPFLEAVNENLPACFWFLDLCPEHSNV